MLKQVGASEFVVQVSSQDSGVSGGVVDRGVNVLSGGVCHGHALHAPSHVISLYLYACIA